MKIKKYFKKKSTANFFAMIAAIASMVAAFVSLWTLNQMTNQFQTSLKPELVIKNEEAKYIVKRNLNYGRVRYMLANSSSFSTMLSQYNFDSLWNREYQYNNLIFNLNAFNIGMGVAKDIRLKWDMDTLAIINIFEQNKPFNFIDSISFHKGSYRFYSKTDTNYYSDNHRLSVNEFDFLLPYDDNNDKISIRLPYLYMIGYSYCELMEYDQDFFKRSIFNPLTKEYPPLKLTLEYLDIESEPHNIEYEIELVDGGPTSGSNNLVSTWKQIIVNRNK